MHRIFLFRRLLLKTLKITLTVFYLINAVQLLFRLQEIEEVIKTSQSHPQLFEDIPQLRAIIGFIYMLSGEYAQAMYYIKPLLQEPEKHPIPNITLWGMTCQYFLGETPTQPFSFESLKQDKALLAEHIKHLPKMEMLQPLSSSVKRPVVFVACNDDYFFQHIFHLAYSLHSTNAETLALHLHLYTPNPKILAEIEQLKIRVPGVPIGVSVEYGETQVHHTATYYASARFIRAFQLMEHYSNEIIVLDADTLFNRNWSDFSVQFLPQDEIVLACPAASPFWERVLAGFLYLKPTPLARDFMAQVAHFILDNIERQLLHWFVDQVALSVCDDRLTRNNPAVKHFPSEKLIDIHCTSQALIWAVTTNKMGPPSYQARREKLEKDYANADTP